MPQWMLDLIAGWPMIRANIPTFIVIVILIVGLVWTAMSWAYGSIIRRQAAEIKLLERQKSEAAAIPQPSALKERAELRLHVYGDNRLPDRLSADNIWRWYYMHDLIVMLTPDGAKKREIVTCKLFITFDQPVVVGTMTVTADKPLEHYEVKEFTNRFAIVTFEQALPECNITIQAHS
jgi:hypothetical protein